MLLQVLLGVKTVIDGVIESKCDILDRHFKIGVNL